MIEEVEVCKVWEKYYERQTKSDPCPWWKCKCMPPEREEIQKAVCEGRIQSERNDCNQHLGDRDWHVERIAYFVKNWRDDDPIRMKKPMSEMDIDDGAHRLLAARHLGKKTIQAYEKCGSC